MYFRGRGSTPAAAVAPISRRCGRGKALPTNPIPLPLPSFLFPPPTVAHSLPHPVCSLAQSEDARPNLEAKMRAVGAVLWALLVALVPGVVSELVTLVQEKAKAESALLKPKVMIAIAARNAAHSLPHYLGCIERLEYPKERIAIW